jgi:hypothetical protein
MNYRQTPPIPPFTRCVPRGLVGYEEEKRKQKNEAMRDRDISKRDALKEAQPVAARLKFINALARRFPCINVFAIVATINPWDDEAFKEAVAKAQRQFEMERH